MSAPVMLLGRPARDYAFTAAIWLISVSYTAVASGFPPAARALPLLVGPALILLSTIDLISMTDTRPGRWLRTINPAGAPDWKDREQGQGAFREKLWAWSFVAGLVVLIFLIGLIPATAIYVAASLHFQARRRLLVSVISGLLVAGFAYGLFGMVLQIELYNGLLFGAEW